MKFKDFEETATRLGQKNNLTAEEFCKRNIYNTWSLKYCFAKYSPLSDEQKKELMHFLSTVDENFTNCDGQKINLKKMVFKIGGANIMIILILGYIIWLTLCLHNHFGWCYFASGEIALITGMFIYAEHIYLRRKINEFRKRI